MVGVEDFISIISTFLIPLIPTLSGIFSAVIIFFLKNREGKFKISNERKKVVDFLLSDKIVRDKLNIKKIDDEEESYRKNRLKNILMELLVAYLLFGFIWFSFLPLFYFYSGAEIFDINLLKNIVFLPPIASILVVFQLNIFKKEDKKDKLTGINFFYYT